VTKVIGGDDQRQWRVDRALRYVGFSQTLYTRFINSKSRMQLSIQADHLRIELTAIERFMAVHGKLIIIPFSHIRQVTTDRPQTHWWETHAPGTNLPGLLKAGTFYNKKVRSFWYIRPKQPLLTIELAPDADYQMIVLALNDNLGWRDRIQAACQG
jgi:hypothetical protein